MVVDSWAWLVAVTFNARIMAATSWTVVECALTRSEASHTGGVRGCGIGRADGLMRLGPIFSKEPK